MTATSPATVQPTTAAPRRPGVPARVLAGLGAALLAGAVAGAVARALMRLINLVGGEQGEFSVVGTAMILLVFGVAMIPGAVARALDARRTAVVLLTLGAGFVAFQGTVIATQDLAALDLGDLATGQWLALAAILVAFAASFVGLAVLAWRFAGRFTRR